ncbi:MAG: 8-oxo-dGTP diphosphatase [Candidatus Aenigmatarchaeota archaeon]
MTITATLCYIIRNGKVLLLERAKGIGIGKLSAPGGRLKNNETIQDCAMREVFEETGLKVSELKYHGVLNFFFGQRSKPDWIVHVFSTSSFDGEIKESDAGVLKWFDIEKIPFERMWEDDKHWVPLLLKRKKFKCWFYFDKDIKRLFDYKVEIIS